MKGESLRKGIKGAQPDLRRGGRSYMSPEEWKRKNGIIREASRNKDELT